MSWMAWTPPTAIFFVAVFSMLAGMTFWELRSPNEPRRGLLPMITTRGDRLFIGLLVLAFVNLAWMGFVDLSQWLGAVLGLFGLLATMRWA